MFTTILRGGIGNQLYQVAFSLDMQRKYNINLNYDTKSEFVNDKKYKRLFSLGYLNLLQINFLYKILIKSARYVSIIFPNRRFSIFGVHVIWLNEKTYDPSFLRRAIFFKHVFIIGTGYWQGRLFLKSLPLIDIAKLHPKNAISNIIYKNKESKSIAFSVRLFEEDYDNNLDSSKEIESLLNSFEDRFKSEKNLNIYYISTLTKKPIITRLSSFGKVTEVTIENGYTNTYDILSLIASCDFHFMTYSTFYTWGSIFSSLKLLTNDKRVAQEVYLSSSSSELLPNSFVKKNIVGCHD
jgi:hypothetical protein